MASDPHKTLRDDVRLLGELLGETLRRDEGMPHYERVERVRALAKRTRSSSSGDDFEALAEELRAMPVAAALPVARSFAHFLNLANIAEQHHRVRRRRELERELGGRPQLASIEEALPRLLGTGVSPDALFEAICGLRVELVITAHPTEIMRRTLQHKYNRVAAALAGRDRPDLTPTEREALLESMRREIAGAWHTEEVRRERPSPLDEVRSGMAVFEETIWNAVPELCRSLDRTLRRIVKRPLPLDAAPIRFGSWIGGDRDGNPSVTPEVTRRAALMSRWTALTLYAREVEMLRFELSMARASPELLARAQGAHEPYRAVLRELHRRIEATVRVVEAELTDAAQPELHAVPLTSDEELAEPLRLCDASLRSVGSDLIADGRLTDVLRRVVAFGLTLVRLDVRQESARHTEAVDAIARHKGLGNYAEWNEERRVDFLLNILSQERVLGTEGLRPEPTVADVLATFRTIAEMPRDSLGAYVITQAGRASDVLAVELLQREAGISRPLQGRAAVRDGPRPARRRGRDERAAVDSLVPRPGHARRGTPGSHGRLLRLRKGHRAARRRMGALQGAGVDRRGVSRPRRAHHAVPRPRRNRRPRRRPDPSGDPVAAAGIGRRHAARHRTGRDDSGQVRPARYRPPHARGLHDGDAGGHAQRAAAGQQRMAHDDEPRRRRRAR